MYNKQSNGKRNLTVMRKPLNPKIRVFSLIVPYVQGKCKKKRSDKMEKITVKVDVDQTEVDEAFERVEELIKKVQELKTALDDLSSHIKEIKLDVKVGI